MKTPLPTWVGCLVIMMMIVALVNINMKTSFKGQGHYSFDALPALRPQTPDKMNVVIWCLRYLNIVGTFESLQIILFDGCRNIHKCCESETHLGKIFMLLKITACVTYASTLGLTLKMVEWTMLISCPLVD